MTVKCPRCQGEFSKKSNLKSHMKTAKYCLKLDSTSSTKSSTPSEFFCYECYKAFTQKVTLKNHKCIPKTVSYKMFKEAVDMYNSLEEENKTLREENKTLREENANLKGKYEAASECFTKIANKPTYSVTTNIAKQINNLEPLSDNSIKNSIEDLPIDIFSKGGKSLGQWASNEILNNRVICTDPSRKTFVWKGEDNKPFRDFKGQGLAKKFFTYIHEQKVDELKEWISNTEFKLKMLEQDDKFSPDSDLLRMKLQRACCVGSDCYSSSEGNSTNLSKEFLNTISTLLTKKDSLDFIEDVVTELLIEEGELSIVSNE